MYMEAFFVDLPIVGTIRQCVRTEKGWRGIDDKGVVCDVTVAPGAEYPSDHVVQIVNGNAVGVLMIEWRKRRRRKNAHPRTGTARRR
jgi:hypothetical protein